MKTTKAILVLAAALCLLFSPISSKADSLTFSFLPTNTFSGTAPAGTLTATFTDVVGGVQLVITSSLASSENLDPGKALYLNINPSKESILGNLSFALTANTGFSQASVVSVGADTFKADGDGSYDMLFTYASSTKAFTNGQSQTYLITGGITASDFNFLSEPPSGGNGFWLAAIHVQNTPNGGEGSAWVGATVPEPGILILLGIAMCAIGIAYPFVRKI